MATKNLRTLLRLVPQSTKSRPESPSIRILKEALTRRGVSRKKFVQEADLSYEYVSRVMNSKVKFPAVRETLERFARIADLDPMEFVEYRQLVQNLPESTKKLWKILEENGLNRRDFAERVGISRTYTYEILRGDVPFPLNPHVIEQIAGALDVPPETFEEYLAPIIEWANHNPVALEQVFLNTIFSKMLIERGYCKADSLSIAADYRGLFAPEESISEDLRKIYSVMGRYHVTFLQLCTELQVVPSTMWAFLSGQVHDALLARTILKHLKSR